MADNRQSAGRGGRRRESRPREVREFDQEIIEIARVTRVMAGGKRMRFRACVVIGDRKGKVGMGVAKGADVTMAVNKAVAKAQKHMIRVPMRYETIPHRVDCKVGAARLMLKPAAAGRGIIAGGAVRVVLDLAGVKNVVAKILGTRNKLNNVQATIVALQQLQTVPEKVREAAEEKNPQAKKEK